MKQMSFTSNMPVVGAAPTRVQSFESACNDLFERLKKTPVEVLKQKRMSLECQVLGPEVTKLLDGLIELKMLIPENRTF
jgi:hypothetical protein